MAEVLPLPTLGEVFVDLRGEERTMRVSRHPNASVVVVSLWTGRTCRASFRLRAEDVPRLVAAFESPAVEPSRPAPDPVEPPSAPNEPGVIDLGLVGPADPPALAC
jgi:hypothetical protein